MLGASELAFRATWTRRGIGNRGRGTWNLGSARVLLRVEGMTLNLEWYNNNDGLGETLDFWSRGCCTGFIWGDLFFQLSFFLAESQY